MSYGKDICEAILQKIIQQSSQHRISRRKYRSRNLQQESDMDIPYKSSF